MKRLLALAIVVSCAACKGGGPATSPSPPAVSATTADLTFCVTETNRYRAMRGKTPLTRSSTLETFAAEGAKVDGQAHVGHRHFTVTAGPAFAENELPWWSVSQSTSVQEVMTQGIALFWSEGAGGGHYENLIGPYTEVGCGVYRANNEITTVQDFR